MHGYGFDMSWGGWWMLLFWLGVLALIIWGVRSLIVGSTSSEERRGPSAQDIAARRYAQGEISREEYFDLISDLELPHKAKRSER